MEVYKGKRFKLVASDGNCIDSLFVDRRTDPKYYPRSHTLIITCDGNIGYYETSITMGTALGARYSVLGWNYPGFGGSTSRPLPFEMCAAADVVVQFALQKLGFTEENIVVFGWSIGGFPASWLGMNYPKLRALILDATFDDVVPVALNLASRWLYLPQFCFPLVEQMIRMYANLNVADQLHEYKGPVLFYRRTEEEIVITDDSNPIVQKRSNRVNFLLKTFLSYRYPKIVNEITYASIDSWLEKSPTERRKENYDDVGRCSRMLKQYSSKKKLLLSNFPQISANRSMNRRKIVRLYFWPVVI